MALHSCFFCVSGANIIKGLFHGGAKQSQATQIQPNETPLLLRYCSDYFISFFREISVPESAEKLSASGVYLNIRARSIWINFCARQRHLHPWLSRSRSASTDGGLCPLSSCRNQLRSGKCRGGPSPGLWRKSRCGTLRCFIHANN